MTLTIEMKFLVSLRLVCIKKQLNFTTPSCVCCSAAQLLSFSPFHLSNYQILLLNPWMPALCQLDFVSVNDLCIVANADPLYQNTEGLRDDYGEAGRNPVSQKADHGVPRPDVHIRGSLR